MSLEIENIKPIYFSNEEDIVRDVFLPLMKDSKSFFCVSGYFTTNIISELAIPFSHFFKHPESKCYFVISPNLSEEEKKNFIEAYQCDSSVSKWLLNISPEKIKSEYRDFFSYLIRSERLVIKVAILFEGMMHAKFWLFKSSDGDVVVHGSGNATKSGLLRNFEQYSVDKSWDGKLETYKCDEFEKRFSSFWNEDRSDCVVLPLNKQTVNDIFKSNNDAGYILSFEEASVLMDEINKKKSAEILTVPSWFCYRDGDYSHQGSALDSWISEKGCGILEIATGGGKTLTALLCASIALEKETKALVVIAVPNNPLIKQWGDDVRKFSIEPHDSEGIGTKRIVEMIKKINQKSKFVLGHDVIILTHDAIKNFEIKEALSAYKHKKMLIADEVHNLGSKSFVDYAPEFFDYRLGLSATPVRQYDEEGTEKLLRFFNGVVFEFSLKEAIGKCLVSFKYTLNKVYLTAEEFENWMELSNKISEASWSETEESKKYIEQLLIRRRAISESAEGKIKLFEDYIRSNENIICNTLVFSTDKNPAQLNQINNVLSDNNITFHQITGEESSNQGLMRNLIGAFKLGSLKVLTSKKVLDEGFNIPQIENAIFMASSGTKRTWVQRLGRVLRKCEGKKKAFVVDFIVLPPEINEKSKALLKSEIDRVQWFCSLASEFGNDALSMSNDIIKLLED